MEQREIAQKMSTGFANWIEDDHCNRCNDGLWRKADDLIEPKITEGVTIDHLYDTFCKEVVEKDIDLYMAVLGNSQKSR